jgi:hypothetical protein
MLICRLHCALLPLASQMASLSGSGSVSGRCSRLWWHSANGRAHELHATWLVAGLPHGQLTCGRGFACLQDVKWADYSDFQLPDANANPPTPTVEPGDVAAMMASLKPQVLPKLRLDWDAAHAMLAAANATLTQ